MSLSSETTLHIRSMTRALYVVVDEEDRFILQYRNAIKGNFEKTTYVYNAAVGLQPIGKYVDDWQNRKHEVNTAAQGINEALINIYKDASKDSAGIYLITDPERWFKDEHVVRRILNIIQQGHNNHAVAKCLVFIGHRRVIPEKLQRYIEVVTENEFKAEEVTEVVTELCTKLEVPVPANAATLFNGLTSYEMESAMTQAVVSARMNRQEREIDPNFIAQYKRSQIKKTDLVQLVDTKNTTFDSIGGAQRFKAWARKQKAAWTDEGRAFGLEPPRGVLLVGVYGCGKSLSAQALSNEWKLPLVQFEMGKLRSSAVGESEANLYRALRIVDSVAPCIMWIDEAEKSLAGSASSSYSDAGTTSRLLGILSTWTQESKVPVCLVMTANSLKTLPPEMVNRLPERFFFDLPSEEDRIDILKIHGKKVKQDVTGFKLALLSEKAKNLVGREIEQAIKSAMVESFHQKKSGLDENILSRELERKPRIVTTMKDEIEDILRWVGYDASVDDGVRARLASDTRSEQFVAVSTK
jgi:AAA+ superfamily predicted ATPase